MVMSENYRARKTIPVRQLFWLIAAKLIISGHPDKSILVSLLDVKGPMIRI